MNKLKPFLYLIINWLIIIICLLITKQYLYFFPLAFILISNRQFANYLIGHEGLHGHISSNKIFNDLFTIVFCLGPVFVSLQSYREKHLMHHEFLGTVIDTDRGLYSFYPIKKNSYLMSLLRTFFSFKMALSFISYFTPFFEFNKKQFYRREKLLDFLYYFITIMAFSFVFIFTLGWKFYLFLWLGPLLLLMPYYNFVSALQHGAIHEKSDEESSRNIVGNWFTMEVLLPCATNYHGVHHLYPKVPYYLLRKVHQQKKLKGVSYIEAVKELLY